MHRCRVGKGAKRRAHAARRPVIEETVGALRFTHPTPPTYLRLISSITPEISLPAALIEIT
jgi:hypothetical protein